MIYRSLLILILSISAFSADYNSLDKFSPYTSRLINRLNQSDTNDIEKIFLTRYIDGQKYFGALVLSDDYDFNLMDEFDIIYNDFPGKIKPILIPQKNFLEVASSNLFSHIQIDEPVGIHLDLLRQETKANDLHNGLLNNFSFQGENVIVGVIDFGFDYLHESFLGSNGRTRVIYAWNQTQTTNNSAPAGFGYGREYSGSSLNNERYDLPSSHGTHVAGIASGRGDQTGQFKGIAPKSDVILVTPLADDDTDFINTGISDILNGIYYIFQKAEQLGKPCVINISLGTNIGPHDGSALFDQACLEIIGPGKCLVTSAGNNGFSNTTVLLDSENSNEIRIASEPLSSEFHNLIDIWGEEGETICVSFPGKTIEFCTSQPGVQDGIFSGTNGTVEYEFILSNRTFNRKPRVFLSYLASSDERILLDVKSDGDVFVWNAGLGGSLAGEFLEGSNITDPTNYYQIAEIGGNSDAFITVGSYTSKASFSNVYDFSQRTFSASVGYASGFSSLGPTANGISKPDISAPGEIIISAMNNYDEALYSGNQRNSPIAVARNNDNRFEFYGGESGTSMSSPAVAGCIALMFQANPTLTTERIREILQSTAIEDSYTLAGPTEVWGAGKLNILAAVEKALAESSLNFNIDFELYPNPFNMDFYIRAEDLPVTRFNLKVINTLGVEVYDEYFQVKEEPTYQVQLNSIPSGVYYAVISTDNFTKTFPIIKASGIEILE